MSFTTRFFTTASMLLVAVPFLASCQGEPQIDVSKSINSYTAKLVVEDNGIPWGMDWLPNGDMLVTYREGAVKRYQFDEATKGYSQPKKVSNVPEVAAGRQGGLLDIKLHPDYEKNGWIYLSYSKAGKMGNKSTAISRVKLKDNAFTDHELIYAAEAYDDAGVHFGSRIAFDGEGYLYFSIGDRGSRDVNPQDLTRDAGKIYRLTDDGKVPQSNPFAMKKGMKAAVYSYGHRNPQGMTTHPETGKIWSHEHGPRGGDEVNLVKKGVNYGWPVISYGINYSGTKFTDITEKAGMEQPLWYWDPSIAPSGMTFVAGDKYPDWKDHLLVGSLKFGYIVKLKVSDDKVESQEIAIGDLMRVRNVAQAPDGYIYAGVDTKGIYRIEPSK